MEINPDDLNFPKAVVARIIKEALPEGVTVSKEAKNAIARSAAIFILHATSLANDNAQLKKRKNLVADDILYAIRQLECEELEKPVKEAMTHFTLKKSQQQQHRRERRAERAKERKKERLELEGKGEARLKKRQPKEQTEDGQGNENDDDEDEIE